MMKKCNVGATANATPSSSSRRQQRSRSHSRGGRSKNNHRSVRGVPNIAKETQLLRNRLDKVVECFQDTIDSHSQTQTTRLELLQTEKKQLHQQIRQLEIENFKYFSELEDSDDLMVTIEENRLASRKEVSVLKRESEALLKEVAILKEAAVVHDDVQQQKIRNKNNVDVVNTNTMMMMMQKEEVMMENTSLKKELYEKDNTIHELEVQLTLLGINILLRNKENTVRGGVVIAANEEKDSPIITENSNEVDSRRPPVLRKNKDKTIVLQSLTNHTKLVAVENAVERLKNNLYSS
ncbi:hypothetical protein FRACYDRAFT_250175 [Fragilariopsis cylindrus CCMP1102]|uniref:Uncharacterized protein n=1 Tax=Fragilariopsis cylindrus CCMP1102 TaxID=635003 RepID=A0A1E7ER33_9STRA|nr:hypothetical protein FRACYDRAFT_250175 [Fragilariopsis cylindrus CCMP1102]|eukprot:OEU08381.1 hypothetical protein FRACYDRAFT_250175 [Fragilariopsis cylindrus CCMP1102]